MWCSSSFCSWTITFYPTLLSSVIQTHKLDDHLYVDDTQLYLSLAIPDTNCSLSQLRVCLQNIFHWMTDSKLKLNANKTVSQKQLGKLDLHSLLTRARQPRQLLSFNSNLLFVPSVKTNVGTRAFSVAAPTLWNSLPVSVQSVGNRTFRHELKTHLFKLAYPP